MAFIKEESEDVKIEETFRVKQEETEEQTGCEDGFFPDALKPQIRELLSDVLATGLEQPDGEANPRGPRTGSLHLLYAELLNGDQEHQFSITAVEPIKASYPTK